MAVVWVRPVRARQIGTTPSSMTGVRVYKALVSNKTTDTPDVVIANAGVPATNAAWSVGLPGLKATDREAKELDEAPVGGGALYEVTVNYATRTSEPEQQDPNPLNRPPVVRLTFDSFDEEVAKSQGTPEIVDGEDAVIGGADAWRWGKSVCNSAGDKFDPSIVECFRDPVITVTKNVPALPWNIAFDVVDTINSNDFTITYRGVGYTVPAKKGWMYDLNTDPGYENGVYYEAVTAVIKARKDGWLRRVEDRGYQELKNGDRPPKPILDDAKNPVMVPALLDGSGKAKPGGDNNPVWLKFRFKGLYDFSTLPYFGTPVGP